MVFDAFGSFTKAATIWGFRVSIDLLPRSGLDQALVHSHMSLLTHVSDFRDQLATFAPVEPILAYAAREHGFKLGFVESVRRLCGLIAPRDVAMGDQGEFFTELLMSRLWDVASQARFQESHFDGAGMKLLRFARYMPLRCLFEAPLTREYHALLVCLQRS